MAETYARWRAQTRYAAWQQIKERADGLVIINGSPPFDRCEAEVLDLTQAICEGRLIVAETEVEQEAQRCAVELLQNRVQQLEAAIALHVDACAKPVAFDVFPPYRHTELEAERETALVEASDALHAALKHGWPWT